MCVYVFILPFAKECNVKQRSREKMMMICSGSNIINKKNHVHIFIVAINDNACVFLCRVFGCHDTVDEAHSIYLPLCQSDWIKSTRFFYITRYTQVNLAFVWFSNRTNNLRLHYILYKHYTIAHTSHTLIHESVVRGFCTTLFICIHDVWCTSKYCAVLRLIISTPRAHHTKQIHEWVHTLRVCVCESERWFPRNFSALFSNQAQLAACLPDKWKNKRYIIMVIRPFY